MSSILISSVPAHGHVTPLLALAEGLVKRGDLGARVAWSGVGRQIRSETPSPRAPDSQDWRRWSTH